MTRVLTVDDSRAQRTIVIKALSSFGCEFVEAENGVQGLERLAEGGLDLVILDVTMPEMDGPTMLQQMRARGDQTPVILLTAESKTALIAPMLGQGVTDYILKPFNAEQLCAKVAKTLGPPPAPSPLADGERAAGESPHRIPAAGKPFVDVLLVDDMENVGKKLRQAMPAHVTMSACLDGQSALAICRERVFRTIIVDLEIPDVDSPALASQLRALQPSAAFIALVLRTQARPLETVRAHGFDGYLVKPFDPAQIEEFLSAYYDSQELVSTEGNTITVSGGDRPRAQEQQYFTKVAELVKDAIGAIGAACHDFVVLDLSAVPRGDRLSRFVMGAVEQARELGMTVRVVGTGEHQASLAAIVETASLPFFADVPAAQKQVA